MTLMLYSIENDYTTQVFYKGEYNDGKKSRGN